MMEPALLATTRRPSIRPKIRRPLCPSTVETGKLGISLYSIAYSHLDIVGEIAQTRTENDPHLGGKLPDLRTDECGGLKNLI